MNQSNDVTKLVFFIDVDNTLIDNDKVKVDISNQLEALLGKRMADSFWQVYEQVRRDLDGVNIPETLHRVEPFFEKDLYQQLYRLWMQFPYTQYIFPGVFEALAHIRSFATPVILSDGDASFQLRKIVKTGLARAVEGNVLIYLHKNHHFQDIKDCFEANHYVMVEDKPNLLAEAKNYFGDCMTTVLVKQGKYAKEQCDNPPNATLDHIADLQKFQAEQFIQGVLSIK